MSSMPETRTASQIITDEATSWPGVEAGIGSRGEYGFTVGRRQIGHMHGDYVAHFSFPKAVWAELQKFSDDLRGAYAEQAKQARTDKIDEVKKKAKVAIGGDDQAKTDLVGKLFKDLEAHIKGNAELTRQASNGWARVLHFGDRYGTPYSRKVGQAMLDRLKSVPSP